ncbi:hypothetical protein VKT23_019746 [Stygiomarasmius scandens]|uniref:Uncharacterized protein n=1 Tax=Marasmiellus scandens TaxID=2682957 RepID=A0ABR1IKS5_9AGAR
MKAVVAPLSSRSRARIVSTTAFRNNSKPQASTTFVRKTRSGNTFAVWDGRATIRAPEEFDLAKAIALAQNAAPIEPDRVQDDPPLDSSESRPSSTTSTPLSSPPSSRPSTPNPSLPESPLEPSLSPRSSSPLSPMPSEPPSPKPAPSHANKRKRTRRSNKKKNAPSAPSTQNPNPQIHAFDSQKKSTARSHISRGRKRVEKREVAGPTAYET